MLKRYKLNSEIMSLQDIETDELLQMYANANTTCSCGGHYKGGRNEVLRENYATELESRSIIVPKTLNDKLDDNFVSNVEIPRGIFNGKGSY